MMVDFCLHKNLRLVKINQENSVAELTGMPEGPISSSPHCEERIIHRKRWNTFIKYKGQLKWVG